MAIFLTNCMYVIVYIFAKSIFSCFNLFILYMYCMCRIPLFLLCFNPDQLLTLHRTTQTSPRGNISPSWGQVHKGSRSNFGWRLYIEIINHATQKSRWRTGELLCWATDEKKTEQQTGMTWETLEWANVITQRNRVADAIFKEIGSKNMSLKYHLWVWAT